MEAGAASERITDPDVAGVGGAGVMVVALNIKRARTPRGRRASSCGRAAIGWPGTIRADQKSGLAQARARVVAIVCAHGFENRQLTTGQPAIPKAFG